jgi:hypothetical protein
LPSTQCRNSDTILSMIKTGLVALTLLAAPCFGQQQKVLLENEFVRVLDYVIGPNVFEPTHSHARGVTIAFTDYDNETRVIPGGKLERKHTAFGEVRWAEPVTHEAKNIGSTSQHVVRIELKQDAPSGPAPKPDALDSLLVSKDTQTLILENRFVRVIREKVPAGVAQAKHRHARGLVIPLANAEIELVNDPGGQPVRRSVQAGVPSWSEAVVHTARNVGTTEMHNIRIEVK